MVEVERGCGFRKIHGLYLCGSGMSVTCDRLPYVIHKCVYCGFVPSMFRGFSWINMQYLLPSHAKTLEESSQLDLQGTRVKCKCPADCPLCYPSLQKVNGVRSEKFGFMWVSKIYYPTPKDFIDEAVEMGVSKRISYRPLGLRLGTWILLAHKKVGIGEEPAIFYAFKLESIQYLLWESEATDKWLKELKDAGLEPVIIPDGEKRHG